MSNLSKASSGSIVSLADVSNDDRQLVGGKAHTLAALRNAGFKVPDGCAISNRFFDSWTDQIRRDPGWRYLSTEVNRSQPIENEAVDQVCTAVQQKIEALDFDGSQKRSLAALLDHLTPNRTLAVRSSSIDEDLENLSFAGQYSSILNVRAPELADAMKACFLSAYTFRVIQYKMANGVQLNDSGMAVLVQYQIESRLSGVAFSINPLNNDFDELVVNVSAGLGEELVGGHVTPEYWRFNKVTGDVIEFRNRPGRTDGAPLLADQLGQTVRETVQAIESHQGNPVDVEFAFDQQEMCVLQCRPVTNWIPLPKEMQTQPGAKRKLYVDGGISDGITIGGALTPLTNDLYFVAAQLFTDFALKSQVLDTSPETGFVFSSGTRSYGNLSMMLDYLNPKDMAESRRYVDVTLADLYANADFTEYKADQRTPKQVLFLIWILVKLLWKLRPVFYALLMIRFNFSRFTTKCDVAIAEFHQSVGDIDTKIPIEDLIYALFLEFGKVTLYATAPGLMALIVAGRMKLTALAKNQTSEVASLIDDLKAGGHNFVRDMGIAMHRLAHALPNTAYEDLGALNERIQSGDVSDEFLEEWHRFRNQYGCRGPNEMDLASPKYGDDIELLLRQLKYVRADESNLPEEKMKENRRKRSEAVVKLAELTTPKVYRGIKQAYEVLTSLEHVREYPKHHVTMVCAKLRERLLELAHDWVTGGRLDHVNDIFELKFSHITRAEQDPNFDIRNASATNGAFYRKVKNLVRCFPPLVDSRGRIIRLEPESLTGQWHGAAVSPGVARGRANVVHDPNRQEILPGDILVAYTTDPGWTPLFINAAGIVLEVGGELQHGAQVAREYGKPCVAGVVGAVKEIKTGQEIEVNGTSGTISIVEVCVQEN